MNTKTETTKSSRKQLSDAIEQLETNHSMSEAFFRSNVIEALEAIRMELENIKQEIQ